MKDRTQYSLRLDAEDNEKLKIIAKLETRSVSNMIEYLIKKEIRRYEAEHGSIEALR